ILSALLSGSWRESPTPPEISAAEFESVATSLEAAGVAPLCWRRVRDTELGSSSHALRLQHAQRFCAIHAALQERTIGEAFALLRSACVEPILIKGWAAAQLYPERGLRPPGDVDLCVPPDKYNAARRALENLDDADRLLDLHRGLKKLDDARWEELYARSTLLPLGEMTARVLSPEDHLRVLCVHLLKHGAGRPLWLCDIAAAVEGRPEGFDWNVCLGRDERRADWVACAVGLAHMLLGAKIENTPVGARAGNLPAWLVSDVLIQWEEPRVPAHYALPMANHLRGPRGLARSLRARWPNPTEATASLRGPFNDWPRWPFQIGNCALRAANFLAHLPAQARSVPANTKDSLTGISQLPEADPGLREKS
ncbi:MAG TPA: nucleotidyltransferase family protein, partial [Pyrinomonadaceae bacterium]